MFDVAPDVILVLVVGLEYRAGAVYLLDHGLPCLVVAEGRMPVETRNQGSSWAEIVPPTLGRDQV
jgi:hypothetical protein